MDLFLSIWNYLKGYVIVEVSGYALEKFVNLAIKDKHYFWNITRSNNKMYIHTSANTFKRLKPYAKKSKCHIRIVEKRGLPFLRFRYRKRWMLGMGTLVFIGLMYLLCSFVWLIEVEGCRTLNETEVIETLEKKGYEIGKLKKQLDLRQAEQILIDSYQNIVWTGIKFEGTKLVIEISEAIPKPEMIDETKPCHLVANKDALITYIVADRGMPLVKKGDTVRKGDLLVSGSLPYNDESGMSYLTHAKAEIKAKSGYALEAKLPLWQMKKEYTGRVSSLYSFKLFQYKIPFFKAHQKESYDFYDGLVTVKQFRLTNKFPLPFYYEKVEKVEYTPYKEAVEQEVAKERLYVALYDQLLKKIGQEAQVIYHEVDYKLEKDVLYAKLQAVVEEDIREVVYLTENEMINPNGVEGENE